MLINGLKWMQYFQALTFSLKKISRRAQLITFLGILFVSGCDFKRTIDIEYFNISEHRINVTVVGTEQDASPGVLVPNDLGETVPVASSIFYEPVKFDDIIKIEWTVDKDDTKHEQEFKRDDLGIPSIVNGGTIKFTYSKSGEWEIQYSR